jgi:hypothetical protein
MKQTQAWKYLAGIFIVFWIIFAIMLIFFSGFPFVVISLALTVLLMLSVLVTALAWAYQNNW